MTVVVGSDAAAGATDDEIAAIADELAAVRARCQPVLVIAGSGVSAGIVPLMDDIMKKALEVFSAWPDDPVLKRHPEIMTEEGLRDLFRRDPDPVLRHSEAWRTGVMEGWLLGFARKAPGPQHEALVDLMVDNLIRAIVTPNWDSLFEGAATARAARGLDSNRLCYRPVADVAELEQWLQTPRAEPALVKLHGDIRQRECSYRHVSPNADEYCRICGRATNVRFLLPDSARRSSREIIDRLSPHRRDVARRARSTSPLQVVERLDHLGAILVIGFSGYYDRHLQELIRSYAENGARVFYLDIDPNYRFGGKETLLRGDAADLMPRLAEAWKERSRPRLGTGGRAGLPELTFVEAEERFDAIVGRLPVTALEARILSHPEFARLREIKQLGQKQRFYPSADHSRYEHAVASLSVVDTLYGGLVEAVRRARVGLPQALAGYEPTAEERQLVRLATLLHDFGHVWFSHLGEDVLREWYEDWEGPDGADAHGASAIVHEDRIKDFLDWGAEGVASDAWDDGDAADVSLREVIRQAVADNGQPMGIGEDDFFALLSGNSRLGHLNALIASSVDADKLEYLTRDASRTGKGGGNAINVDTLAQGLDVTEFGRAGVRLEVVSDVERVAAERYLMFQSVYHDDRVMVLERSLAGVLREYLEMKRSAPLGDEFKKILLWPETRLLADVKETATSNRKQVLKRLGGRGRNRDPELVRYEHWLRVLRLLKGVDTFPDPAVWVLTPTPRILQLPLEDARREVEEGAERLRGALGELFKARYLHMAVFALSRFVAHTGTHEVPIIAEQRLYAPADVSPLIAGLQDVRRSTMRLAVGFFDDDVRDGCTEEIDNILNNHRRYFEAVVRLRGMAQRHLPQT